jgi:N-methylhydantoinase A
MDALAGAVAEGQISPHDISVVLHATTLVSNALIERKGAKVALITTAGFRDVIEIAREKKYDTYDIAMEKPPSLVPDELRFEIVERIVADGTVLQALDRKSVERAVRNIRAQGCKAVAVCLLHSHANCSHERQVGAIIKKTMPDALVSLSSDVLPEIREYERTSTTAANAYVQPLTEHYLSRFTDELWSNGMHSALYIMLSSGGIATPEIARRFPVRIVESGPAAGAVTAANVGKMLNAPKILSFDMGGTTAKTCLIHDHQPVVTSDFEVARMHRFKRGSGLPLRIPVVDLIEIGAGGGSIARVDNLDLLKVGPDSVGADPGPACYGLGGDHPTVTDADLVLSYLDENSFLGGRMKLDRRRAENAIKKHIADPLGLSLGKAALGIHTVVNENMANASRIHAVERGHDPASYTLVAFGGAGPVHAYGVARRLRIKRIVVPPSAGLGSAVGLLLAPRSYHLSQTCIGTLDDLDWKYVNRMFDHMRQEANDALAKAGLSVRGIDVVRTADLRYRGQRKELSITLPAGRLGPDKHAAIRAAFEQQYHRIYRRRHPEHQVEAINWRLVASGSAIASSKSVDFSKSPTGSRSRPRKRNALFPEIGHYRPCSVYRREELTLGHKFAGPALIEDTESTIVVGPSAVAHVDKFNNIVIDIR